MSSRAPKISLTNCSSPKRTPPSKGFQSFRPNPTLQSPVHSPSKLETLTSPINFNNSLFISKDFENPISEFTVETNTRIVMLTAEVERLKEINSSLQAERDLHNSQRYQGELQKELYLKLINSYQEIENLNKIIEDITSKKPHPDERVQNLLMDLTYWKKKVFELEPRIEDLEAKVFILEADKEKLNIEIKARAAEIEGLPKKFASQIKALSNEHEHLRRQLEEARRPKRTLTSERKESAKKAEEPLKLSNSKMNSQRESRMQNSNSQTSFAIETTRSESLNQPNKENMKFASPNKKVSEFLAENASNQKPLKSDGKPPRDNSCTPTIPNTIVEDIKKENQYLKSEVLMLSCRIKDWSEEMERLKIMNNQLSQTAFTTSDGADERIKYFLDEIEALNNTILKKSKDNTALVEENKKLQLLVGEVQKLKNQNLQLSSEYDNLKVTTAAIINEIEAMKSNIKLSGRPKI